MASQAISVVSGQVIVSRFPSDSDPLLAILPGFVEVVPLTGEYRED
jgi:hypothetical protein